MLKPVALVFLLEKRPQWVRYGEQFFIVGLVSGLGFAVIENLLYRHFYLADFPPEELDETMMFRWIVCVFLHLSCTFICCMGLRRAWLVQKARGLYFDIKPAILYILMAAVIHTAYNTGCFLGLIN